MSVVGGGQAMSSEGLGRTLRALRDPLLLFAVPVAFALLLALVGYGTRGPSASTSAGRSGSRRGRSSTAM